MLNNRLPSAKGRETIRDQDMNGSSVGVAGATRRTRQMRAARADERKAEGPRRASTARLPRTAP